MATIEGLTQQVSLLARQVAQQQQQIAANAINETRFNLTPNEIIRNFDEIPAFSGESSFKLKSFLNTVSHVEDLCGLENNNLKLYCLGKLINSKIIGRARHVILEIPEDQRTWDMVVKTLTQRFRPRQTIHQLLYQAKDLKVWSIKDAFEKLLKIKSDANEICDFDNESQFTYMSIDRELVQILKFKLIPIIQLQIDSSKSLSELDNLLFQSEIYFSEESIKQSFKLNKNNFSKDRQNNYNLNIGRNTNPPSRYPSNQNNVSHYRTNNNNHSNNSNYSG